MIYGLYVIYDRKAQVYSMPQCYNNDNVAKRNFNYICSQYQDKETAFDLELYKVGEYNNLMATISVTSNEKPIFIMSYSGEVQDEKE